MTPAGFDTPANSPRKQGISARGDAKSDATTSGTDANPAELTDLLARLAVAWNRLDAAGQAEVVDLAERLAGPFEDVGAPLARCDLRTTGTSSEHASAP